MSQDTPATDMDTDTPLHDASFVPQLDARQRAMLAEMGVRVWAPQPAAQPASAATPAAAPAGEAPGSSGAAAFTATPRHAAAAPPAAPTAPPARSTQGGTASPTQAQPPLATAPRAATAPVSRQAPAAPPAQAVPALSPMADGVDTMDWAALREAVASCQACGLCQGRTQAVFGVGNPQADWMVVGDAPGALEDQQGEPYLGEAGQLLDNMLRAVGRSRTGQGAQAAYVTHVIKCRPSTNRNPQPAEVAQCAHYLAREVALVQPRVIIALGPLAAQALLQSQEPIGKLRGHVHAFQGVPVVVTFHPSQLLRTPANKGKAWADLCLALEQLQAQVSTG